MRRLVCDRFAMAAVAGLLATSLASLASAAPLQRMSADFQNSTSTGVPEVSTTAAPAAGGIGGIAVYNKTLKLAPGVAYITVSGGGDTHNGSALMMSANIADDHGTTVCQPLAGGGLDSAGPTGWITLVKLPASDTGTNCDDGGGGTADCHDNAFSFSCCVQLGRSKGNTRKVEVRLADSPGGGDNEAFYERATFYVDWTTNPQNPQNSLCKAAALPTAAAASSAEMSQGE